MWLRAVQETVSSVNGLMWNCLEITIRSLLKFNNEFDNNCTRWKRLVYIIWCVLDYTRAKKKKRLRNNIKNIVQEILSFFLSPEIVLNRGYTLENYIIRNYIMSWSLKKSMRDVSLISHFFHARSFPFHRPWIGLGQRNKMIEKEEEKEKPSVQSTFLKKTYFNQGRSSNSRRYDSKSSLFCKI